MRLQHWILGWLALLTLLGGWVALRIFPSPDRFDREWREDAGYAPLIRYPPRDANETALELERAVRPLGFDFVPLGAEIPAPREGLDELMALARRTLFALRTEQPELAGLPPELDDWLADNQPSLRSVTAILDRGVPQWALHLEKGAEMEIPNYLDHMSLHRLLVLSAARSDLLNEPEASRRFWRAARSLRNALRVDPIVITQLVLIAEERDTMTLARALPHLEPGDSLPARPDMSRRRMEESIRLDFWLSARSAREDPSTGEESPIYVRWPMRLLARASARHLHLAMDHGFERLATEDLTQLDPLLLSESELERIPRWSLLARLYFPASALGSYLRAARHDLDLDLTRRSLRLARDSNACRDGGRLELPEPTPAVVSGIDWLYSREGDAVVIEATAGIETGTDYEIPLRVSRPIPTGCSVSFAARSDG